MSDQIMGRALMTPDELRRMDNDDCIIFEKGLKPIKAKKFWYFKKPMARELSAFCLSHNNFDAGVRGEWRKFDPANPYVKSKDSKKEEPQIEALDDLFEDVPNKPAKVEDQEEVPTLPMEPNSKEDEMFSMDLEKELEAKFDELFGPVDDENK